MEVEADFKTQRAVAQEENMRDKTAYKDQHERWVTGCGEPALPVVLAVRLL